MSGHSHFKTVKATKDANDAKKGKVFSKLAGVIAIAAKEKGTDPATNANLKSAIEYAKRFNMPKENIERAIKKGSGESAGENLQEVSFEGFGPFGIALIVEGITDNKNRTLGEIKSILGRHEGKMAGEGAVKWMFEKRGVLEIDFKDKSKEELELLAIESGASDFKYDENIINIYTKPDDLEKVKKDFEEKGLQIESSGLEWIPKEEVMVGENEKEKLEKLFEELDENDAIQDIYSNLKE